MFLVLKEKKQRTVSQVPGLGHVTFYLHPGRYPTLFHSPLVGVDKETLATCTLSFTREVRKRKIRIKRKNKKRKIRKIRSNKIRKKRKRDNRYYN